MNGMKNLNYSLFLIPLKSNTFEVVIFCLLDATPLTNETSNNKQEVKPFSTPFVTTPHGHTCTSRKAREGVCYEIKRGQIKE